MGRRRTTSCPSRRRTYYYRQIYGCFFRDQHGLDVARRRSASTTSPSRPTTRTPTRPGPHTKKVAAGADGRASTDDVVYKIVRGNAIRMLEPRPLSTTRHIELEGPANFRDLGGYAAAGGRVVRHGRVFRSDSLASLSEADLRYVVATLGLRTAVDLRAGHEVDDHPHQPLAEAGVVVHHRPIVDETRASR